MEKTAFYTEQQGIDACTYLSTPLEEQLKWAEPPNMKFIRAFFDNAKSADPGLTVRDNISKPYSELDRPQPYKEILWCNDADCDSVLGRATVFERGQKWKLDSIAVEQHLPQKERRKIANAMYDVLFANDWIHFPGIQISAPAIKARRRQYRTRLCTVAPEFQEDLIAKAELSRKELLLLRDILTA